MSEQERKPGFYWTDWTCALRFEMQVREWNGEAWLSTGTWQNSKEADRGRAEEMAPIARPYSPAASGIPSDD